MFVWIVCRYIKQLNLPLLQQRALKMTGYQIPTAHPKAALSVSDEGGKWPFAAGESSLPHPDGGPSVRL